MIDNNTSLARLEIGRSRKATGGSNPSLSAIRSVESMQQGPPKAPILFGPNLASCGKYALEGIEMHRNTNPTDQESDTEKAKPVKAG
jgi:hypothetical protein